MATRYRTTYQGFGCSPIKAVRELGLERREVVWFLSTVKIENFCKFTPVREDREGLTAGDGIVPRVHRPYATSIAKIFYKKESPTDSFPTTVSISTNCSTLRLETGDESLICCTQSILC